MTTQADRNAGKFAEPRSWAAKWCGHGLAAERRTEAAPQPSRRPFAEPRGWAARWCSNGLGFKARTDR